VGSSAVDGACALGATASLQALCQMFLDGDLTGPAGCTGRLSSLVDARSGRADVATVRRLLASKQAAARVSALGSIGRAVHLEHGHADARNSHNTSSSSSSSSSFSSSHGDGSGGFLSCQAVLDAGLLPLICACLSPATEEATVASAALPAVAAAVTPTEWAYSAAERCLTTEDFVEVPHLAVVALAVMGRQPHKPLAGRLDASAVLALRAAAARGGRSGPLAAEVLTNSGL
jgi:hypothetical protein